MATYKVPQDVEADDKLLGPFTFRQFVYLMIVFGLVMMAIGLFQIFPLLAVIPIPFALFFVILALPLKKDQPMETYLAAIVSFYTKPNKRFWIPGQSESTILITAPKNPEPKRTRDISGDEASHRLSFLAEIVDTEGHAIKSASTVMRDDFYAEAIGATDMFDKNNTYGLNHSIIKEEQERRQAIVDQMRQAIETSEFNYDIEPMTSPTTSLPNERIVKPREGFIAPSSDPPTESAPSNDNETYISLH